MNFLNVNDLPVLAYTAYYLTKSIRRIYPSQNEEPEAKNEQGAEFIKLLGFNNKPWK